MKLNSKKIQYTLSRNFGTTFFLFSTLILSIFVTSCNKESQLGLDVQPEGDLLNVLWSDTATIYTRTVREDSLRTDETLLLVGDVLLGKYNDPIFGLSSASFYTQIRIPASNPDFGRNAIADSTVLVLVYDNTYIYGDTSNIQSQNINVYRMSSGISQSENYYSNNTVPTIQSDLANNKSFKPHITSSDSVMVNGVKERAQLRIPMDVQFGQTIINNQTSGVLSSGDNFQNFLKGFYITTENTNGLASGEGNIFKVKITDPKSRLCVYYHYTGKTIVTTANPVQQDSVIWTQYDMPMNNVARFSTFKHDYSSANTSLASQLSSSPAAQNTTVFVQPMAGVKTKVTLPYLMNWIDEGAIAINKAELLIRVDSTLSQLNKYEALPNLLLFQINDDGTNNVLMPDFAEGTTYFGGSYNSGIYDYRFNIARYIQQILTGVKKNNGFYIIAQNGGVTANRIVIGGGNSPDFQMKLKLTYTKLK